MKSGIVGSIEDAVAGVKTQWYGIDCLKKYSSGNGMWNYYV